MGFFFVDNQKFTLSKKCFVFGFFLNTENDMNFGQNAKLLNWSFDNFVTVLAASD